MIFHPGQRVLCVDARDAHPWLAEDGVYTVECAYPAGTLLPIGISLPAAVLTLAEVSPLLRPGWGAFLANRFRPLTDISVLEALLTAAPFREVEPA